MKFRSIFTAVLLLTSMGAADQWNKNYKVGESPTLMVTTNDASIEVHAGSTGSIAVNLETRGYSVGGNNPDIRITESQTGDNVTILAKERDNHWCIACSRSAHFDITAPAGTKLVLHTADGSLKVFDIHGPTDLHSSDGSIEVRGFDGILHARTSDGSIRASGRFDDLRLDSSDGSITLEAARGSKVSSDWHVRTSDGSVRAALPDDLAANLSLSTGDGSIHSDLSINDVHEPSKRRLDGKLNGGGRMLEIHTSDGSIQLNRT